MHVEHFWLQVCGRTRGGKPSAQGYVVYRVIRDFSNVATYASGDVETVGLGVLAESKIK